MLRYVPTTKLQAPFHFTINIRTYLVSEAWGGVVVKALRY